MEKKGKIKISSENMMPIIKKWLYSDKDIFLREIVSNAMDAITKHKKLVDMGETQNEENYHVNVNIDEANKTLTIEDNGIGMTAEEVEKYITQIAFSGAQDFLSKYENASGDGIIGHFGLGFYSAYMVSETVEIITQTYKDEPAVRWISDGTSTYKLSEMEKTTRGTKIILHIAEGEEEFLKESRIRELLRKYCSFMPYPIYLNAKDGDNTAINNVTPLYLKDPKNCTDEEYKDFYRETFMDFNEPLFWIHLNMDYPFRLKGILYFPQVKKQQLQLEKGQVKLYCNQVFIAENIKEVIPEFLMLLNGVIDCPDIPLNVSRSFLQNDNQVQKISKHITKKVADKLTLLFNNQREEYEKCWKDISTFIKFGCMKEEEFYEKVKNILVYKNLNGDIKPLNDYFSEKEEDNKEIYYVSDETQQAQYIQMFKEEKLDAIVFDSNLDTHFISFIEYKNPGKCRFIRIDAEVAQSLKNDDVLEETKDRIVEIFKKYLLNQSIQIKVESFKNGKIPAIINVEEGMRRMSELNFYYGIDDDSSKYTTLVLNLTNPIISGLSTQGDEKQKFIVNQIYYLATIAYRKLSPEELSDFVAKTSELLFDYSKLN